MMRRLVSFVTLSLSLPLWGWAQVPNPPNTPPREGIEQAAPGTTPAGARELTAADVEAFLDGILPLQLEQEDIAGATDTS